MLITVYASFLLFTRKQLSLRRSAIKIVVRLHHSKNTKTAQGIYLRELFSVSIIRALLHKKIIKTKAFGIVSSKILGIVRSKISRQLLVLKNL